VGVAVDFPEQQEVQKADDPGGGEAEAPSDAEQEQADERDADGGGKLCRCVEKTGSEAALARRKPVADGFGACGEGRSFADAEEKARGEESTEMC
jgi:hypothetical protein